MRTELAVLDHNNNLDREQATTADGTPRFNVVCPKRTKHWVAKPISVPKCYDWRAQLTRQTVEHRQGILEDIEVIELPDDIPRNIASVERPPKEIIIEQTKSRFLKN